MKIRESIKDGEAINSQKLGSFLFRIPCPCMRWGQTEMSEELWVGISATFCPLML